MREPNLKHIKTKDNIIDVYTVVLRVRIKMENSLLGDNGCFAGMYGCSEGQRLLPTVANL